MRLYNVQIRFKNRRRARYGVDLVVHARSKAAAEAHVARKYTGCTIERTVALAGGITKHFVIADLVDD